MASNGLRELAARVAKFPDEVGPAVLPKVGQAMMAVLEREAAGAMTIKHLRLTGKIAVDKNSVTLTPIPKGPWTFSEYGSRKSGWWEPRKGRTGIRFPDGEVRRYVLHHAIRGRQTWTKTQDAIAKDVIKQMKDLVTVEWKKVV